MQDIKKGDKLLMEIIIRGEVRVQRVSYAYERNGHLCVYWDGFVNTIEEMKGTRFTVLDSKDPVHKSIIKHNLFDKSTGVFNYKFMGGYDRTLAHFDRFDNGGKFVEALNDEFCRLPVPSYKKYLN